MLRIHIANRNTIKYSNRNWLPLFVPLVKEIIVIIKFTTCWVYRGCRYQLPIGQPCRYTFRRYYIQHLSFEMHRGIKRFRIRNGKREVRGVYVCIKTRGKNKTDRTSVMFISWHLLSVTFDICGLADGNIEREASILIYWHAIPVLNWNYIVDSVFSQRLTWVNFESKIFRFTVWLNWLRVWLLVVAIV